PRCLAASHPINLRARPTQALHAVSGRDHDKHGFGIGCADPSNIGEQFAPIGPPLRMMRGFQRGVACQSGLKEFAASLLVIGTETVIGQHGFPLSETVNIPAAANPSTAANWK